MTDFHLGNSGLGAESCLQFARHGSPHIFLGARSRSKAEVAIASIKDKVPNANITHLEMDLSDLASVRTAAESFLAASSRLDILVNNAGIMCCPAAKTKDGFENPVWNKPHGTRLVDEASSARPYEDCSDFR